MNRPRLVAVLLLKHGVIVRSQNFLTHQVIGNPMSTVERFSHWNVDELVLLDISRDDTHDLRRDDIQQRYQGTKFVDVLDAVSDVCFMPLTVGGRIRSLQDIDVRLERGADKIAINSEAFHRPEFITEAAERYGSQCTVISIDAARTARGSTEVFVEGGQVATGLTAVEWATRAAAMGAGEILLNSIDRDGSGLGYDLEMVAEVVEAVFPVPVVALGGVGRYEHLAPAIVEARASAAAAANIFHFFELSYPLAKRSCISAGVPMRPPSVGGRWFSREPTYDSEVESARIEARMARADAPIGVGAVESRPAPSMTWCSQCVYPHISAAPMEFDTHGVCSGCRMGVMKHSITSDEWDHRRDLLRELLERNRSQDGSRHDCVIAVSGGKDSWFQTHVIKNELGFNPLLVTYNGNNWTPVGWRNLHRMKEVFNVDHVMVSPAVGTLQKLNRLAFIVMGDMNWHAHVGITTAPVRVAVDRRIPLVIWGEHGYTDLSGQFSMHDFPEMNYRDRLEHFARGYEWNYFVGREGLSAQELHTWQYPADEELLASGMQGIYLGNYIYWESNEHTRLMVERYGFEVNTEPFDRTYRLMSNLDDMHENGVHDYLKYIKFGYGRATDHACKDVRAGVLTRKQAVELVNRYDHVKPSDLQRWLQYVDMSEETFDRIADTFRDARVWSRTPNGWIRDELRQGM